MSKVINWPDNKRFALCLTHDVDIVSHTWPQRWYYFQRQDPYWQFEKWLELEDSLGFNSTFYFVAMTQKGHKRDCKYRLSDKIRFHGVKMTVSEMMREIHRSGWEIGLHGSYYSATEPGVLAEEKESLEAELQEKVISTRQHLLRWDYRLTPQIQSDCGLLTDSTIGFVKGLGWIASSVPYYLHNILEFPLHVMDTALFREDCLHYSEGQAIDASLELMEKIERQRGVLTLNWHPHNVARSMWFNVYKTLLEEAHKRNAWGTSVGKLYQWWTHG